MVDNLEARLFPEEINAGDIEQQVEGKVRLLLELAQNSQQVSTIDDNRLIPVRRVLLLYRAGEGRPDMRENVCFSHLCLWAG